MEDSKIQKKNTLPFSIMVAIGIGAFFWILETVVELFVLHPEAGPFDLLFPRDQHEMWMRSLIVLLAISITFLVLTLLRRNRIEKTLQKSEAKFHSLFNQASDSIFLLRPAKDDLIMEDVNEAACTIHGYTRNELIGKSIGLLDDFETRKRLPERVPLLMSGRPFKAEAMHVRNDGSTFPIEISAQLIDIDGKPYILAVDRDITMRKKAEQQLQESEERLKLALTAANQGLYDLNVKTGETVVNPEYALMLGYDPTEFVETNQKWIERLHPEDWERVTAFYDAFIKGDTDIYKVEYRQRTKKGEWNWVLSVGKIVERDAGQNPLRMIGTHTDITTRKKVEEALRREKNKLQTYLNTSAVMVVIIDSDQTVSLINNKGCEILGYTKAEIIGKNWFGNFLPERERDSVRDVFSKLMTGEIKPVEYYENYVLTKNGGERLIAWYNTVLRDENDTIIGTLASGGDITEHKKTEIALKISEEQSRGAFDYSSIGMALVSPEGRWLRVNPALCRIVGYNEQELLSMTFQDITYPDDLETDLAHVRKMLAGEIRYYHMEKRYIHKQGHIIWILLSVSLVRDTRGNPLHFVSQIQDITDRKRAEEELRERMKLAELSSEVGVALTKGATLQKSLRFCTETLVNHLDALFARIWTYHEEENILQLRASAGYYTHLDGQHSVIPFGKYKIGAIAMEREPHLTNNVEGDPLISDQEWVKREGIVAFAGHPLIVENKLVGVMALFSRNRLTQVTLKALGSVADIIALGIEQKITAEKILRTKEEWEYTFDIIPDLIMVIDNNYRILRANKAMTDILEMKREEIIGKQCFRLVHGVNDPPDYCPHTECISTGKECVEEIYEENLKGYFILSANPVFDEEGNITGSVQVARDISRRKEMEKKLEEAAITDDLTGLLNRRGFFTLTDQQCKLANRSGRRMSLLYIDLDGFKSINDELGHQTGDQALLDTANILRKTFRQSDIIARVGGDEFAVLITEPSSPDIERIITKHFSDNLKIHNETAGRSYELLFSMGIAHYEPEHRCSISDLINRADERMYLDKKRNKLDNIFTPAFMEKRSFTRFKAEDNCTAETDTIPCEIRVKDISLGGICLESSRQLDVNSFIRLKRVFCNGENITAKSIVVWSAFNPLTEKEYPSLGYEAGLKFVGLSDSAKSLLKKITHSLTSRDMEL